MGYDFNHLILLVGTNPLPNLVVADYFLKINPNINILWLVHSEESKTLQAGTAQLAENLEKSIQSRWPDRKFHFNKVALSDVSDAKSIKRDTEEKLFNNLPAQKGIHLNYTGGTKSMTTHIYWLLKKRELGEEISFSYLDARNFRLIDDDRGVVAKDLRKNVILTFDELVILHGFKRINEEKTTDFSNAYKVFEALIENNELEKLLYSPDEGRYNRNLFLDRKRELAKKTKDLNIEDVEAFTPNEVFRTVVDSMPEKYRLFDASGKFRADIDNKPFKNAVKFLDGGWLEQYVAKTVENEFSGNAMSIAKNVEMAKPGWTQGAKFELDVVVLNGYQPTGISCTTMDNKPGCKSKGFEIIHRIRQIGGDEAKAVLVGFLDKRRKNELQAELAYDTGGNKENILVLGKSDLQQDILVQSLREFIFEI
jgi:hypothetical protein